MTVDYADLKDRVREVTGGGADVVVDPVGGPSAEAALRSLTTYGRYCVVGFAGGEIPRLPANVVLLRNRTVVGVDWGDWARTEPEAATALVSEVLDRIACGDLRPPEPTCLALERAADALTRLARHDVVGKLALVPTPRCPGTEEPGPLVRLRGRPVRARGPAFSRGGARPCGDRWRVTSPSLHRPHGLSGG
ncbi:MAG: zinc-binding dehydrogenase [Actinomycetota bacterium]|nr:zinc-binding dehydrogenase [Actinomycetota bacterium]